MRHQNYSLNLQIKMQGRFCLTGIYRCSNYFCFMKFAFAVLLMAFALVSCSDNDTTATSAGTAAPQTPTLAYSVAATYPHDTTAFTEGLEFYNGKLYESTGMPGKSKLVQVSLDNGIAQKTETLDSILFGEGITVLHDTLYQLTWTNKKVLLYNATTLKKIKEITLNYEGWGLTNDGQQLIESDGSSNLYYYEPGTMRLLRTQGITEDGSPVNNINELEYINGFIYANRYQYDYILKIDVTSGQVVGKLDLGDLAARTRTKYAGAEVLNGIAYNPKTKKIYVTGKYWPALYEINFPF